MNSDVTIAIVSGTVLLFMLVSFIISFFTINHRKKEQLVLEKKNLAKTHREMLLQTQLEIQEQTLRNISQEIHDNIGQVLSLAKLNINTMNCDDRDNLQLKIDDSRHLISKAIQDLRDLSRSLNTDYVVQMGLVRAIEFELEMMKKTGKFETVMHLEGKPYPLEPQQELIMFRIVQEALHNILKHANASAINLWLNFELAQISLTVQDNGNGFDPANINDSNFSKLGLGIKNMYNRAEMIGAAFTLETAVGMGVIISVKLITDKTAAFIAPFNLHP